MTTALLLVLVGAGCFAVGWVASGRRSVDGVGARPADDVARPSLDDVIGEHPIGVAVGDRLGRIEYRNAAARRLSGTHHGVLIDEQGLIVTIGYLIMDADTVTITDIEGNDWPAYFVGYDYESGFGLVRTEQPMRQRPMAARRRPW